MNVSIIVAVAEGGVIGRQGGLPWRLPADMRFFKETTMGHPVIMGRKTWESLPRALPGRVNIVVTRQAGFEATDAQVAGDLDAALTLARETGAEDAFVIGGAQLYALAFPIASTVYLTRVHATVVGDVVLEWEAGSDWTSTTMAQHDADDRHAFAFSILRFDRSATA